MSTVQETTPSRGSGVRSFTLEVGDDSNRTITLNTLRMRLRGHFSMQKLQTRKDTKGKPLAAREYGSAVANLPEMPGMHIVVKGDGKRTVGIVDPLHEQPDKLEAYNAAIQRVPALMIDAKYIAVPNTTHELDENQFKTLIRDCMSLVKFKAAKVIKGDLPTMAKVESLPGLFIADPWNSSATAPRYEAPKEK